MASQLIEEVTAHAQSDSLEDAREICADGTYFPNNLSTSHYGPVEAKRVPERCGSHMSRQSVHEGGKVVSPTHRPPLPPRKYSVRV